MIRDFITDDEKETANERPDDGSGDNTDGESWGTISFIGIVLAIIGVVAFPRLVDTPKWEAKEG